MIRIRNQSAKALFGVALIAVSMLATPSFAEIFGGNADEIPLVTNGYRAGPPQAEMPAVPATRLVDKSSVCHGGYRWIQRDPHPANGIPEEFSLPVPCN